MMLQGGCFCGECRYEFEDDGEDVAHCHCGMCRHASGGTVTTWITVARSGFHWTRGQPRSYQSSEHAHRWFCPTCGTHLLFSDARAAGVDVTVASLDHPEAVSPRRHIWYQNRLPWLHIDDRLPVEMRESDPLGRKG